MKTKKALLIMAVLASLLCLSVSAEAIRMKDPMLTEPEPASHTGLLISMSNPTVCDRLTMMRLGEMRTTRNQDGTWTTVFVAMHFFSYTFLTSHLGVSSLRMDSFDKVNLVGTVIQNGISYPVTGTYFNNGGYLGFCLSWNGEGYALALYPNV